MKKNISIYLDLVRIIATMLVFISHAEKFDGQWINANFPNFGHDAVVIFFVLSGFVIRFIAETKESSLKFYAQARAIRIYSVAVPSLIIVVALSFLGSTLELNGYGNFLEIDWLYIISMSVFFLNEIQGLDLLVPNNGPYWSICYEVSYYVLFAILFYLTGIKKYILFIIASVFIGFKILLLFPLWLLGGVTYRLVKEQNRTEQNRTEQNIFIGWFLYMGSILCYLIYRYYLIDNYLYEISISFLGEDFGHKYLAWSRYFISDYIIGLMVSINFIGFSIIQNKFSKILLWCEKPIRTIAPLTFSIYLIHFPLMAFFSKIYFNSAFILISTIAVIVILGTKIEQSKDSYRALIVRK